MATVDDIVSARATAGSTFAAAVSTLRAAVVELAGYDLALMNPNAGAPGSALPSGTFAHNIDKLRDLLRHPDFATLEIGDGTANGIHWDDAARARAAELLSSIG